MHHEVTEQTVNHPGVLQGDQNHLNVDMAHPAGTDDPTGTVHLAGIAHPPDTAHPSGPFHPACC